MPAASPATRAPVAPAAAPVSSQAAAHFMELKRGLGEIVSWELTSNTWDKLMMTFGEAGSEQQARTFAAILK